jgi:FkbM family methyltransferase
MFKDLKYSVPDCTTIVDAGAGQGSFTKKFLDIYPNATVHCFEPIPEYCQKLRDGFVNKAVVVHPCAVGDSNSKQQLHVGMGLATSSISGISQVGKDIYGPAVTERSIIEIEMARIDSVVKTIDILKLDVHGCELAALNGCGSSLVSVQAIIVELCFVPIFCQTILFQDVNSFLYSVGFSLVNLYHLCTKDLGQIICADGLYRNTHGKGSKDRV